MQNEKKVLALLADGRFHSGEAIGDLLGVTRSAVWKRVKQLENHYALPIQAVRGKGYAIADKIELLDEAILKSALSDKAKGLLTGMDLLQTTPSTHDYLLEKKKQGYVGGHVCLAEHQSKGRGRRGRSWVSPFGTSLYLSVLWRFESGPSSLSGLSLAIATSVVSALEAYGLQGTTIKWPNDLILHRKKLGGILINIIGEANGACDAVVSVGLNVNLPVQSRSEIDQPVTDAASNMAQPVQRNIISGLVLDRVLLALELFAKQGFAAFHTSWRSMDSTFGQKVKLLQERQSLFGVAKGVSDDGDLLLDIDGELHAIKSGEVSLRMAEATTAL